MKNIIQELVNIGFWEEVTPHTYYLLYPNNVEDHNKVMVSKSGQVFLTEPSGLFCYVYPSITYLLTKGKSHPRVLYISDIYNKVVHNDDK